MDTSPIIEQLRELQLLRVLWCDNSNIIRTKGVFLPPMFENESDPNAIIDRINRAVTITAASQSLPAIRDEPVLSTGLAPVLDIRLVPAWETFSVCPQTPRIGTVIGDMVLKDHPWVHCPRHFLARMQHQLETCGLHVELGFELEFYLFHQERDAKGELVPVDQCLYGASLAAQKSQSVISDMLDALWAEGLPVAQYNPETGPGQHEISFDHDAPITTADRIVKARESIHATALKHELIASFVPMLYDEATGNGMHTHFSLWSDGKNLLPDSDSRWGISETAEHFTAGVLEHLPALMAISTPSVNSFHRTQPHEWSGAYQAWGVENKEAALRMIRDTHDVQVTHIELKTVDCAANPYLAFGGILATGMDGIERQLALPDPVEVDPGNLTDAERAERGIRRLPTSLDAAIERFKSDTSLKQAMGPEQAKVYAQIREAEFTMMQGMSLAEEAQQLLERF